MRTLHYGVHQHLSSQVPVIPGNVRRDSRFALQACCCILTILSVSKNLS